jgi:peptide/nickel transport system substrate-binding protein
MSMSGLKRWLKYAAVAVAAVVAVGAGGSGTVHTAQAGGTLIWGTPAEMSVFDPHVACGWLTYNATGMIFEGLVGLDLTKPDAPAAVIKPALAKSWDISDDGLVYTFHLREGVKFHDGTSFNAEVAKWNYDRFWDEKAPQFNKQAKAFLGYFTRWIKAVEAPDGNTLKITLTEPNYEFLGMSVTSCGQPLMMSPETVKKYGDEQVALHPVGTGPFKFVEREQNVKVVLERNNDYWGEKAKLDKLIFRPLEDPATRLAAIRAGEVNMITETPWDEIDGLVKDGFQLSTQKNVPSIWFTYFNFENSVLKDKRVRQAINMAIDREGIVRDILKGNARPEAGMLSAGTYAYDPNFKSWKYDPDGAKKLLAEAGYANGVDIQFDIFQYGYNEVWEKWIQRDLKKVGINLKLNKYEWVTYMGKWIAGMPPEIGMNEIGWGWASPYWTGIVSRCDHRPPNGFNSGHYCNPKVDELLDQARKSKDRAAAAKLYQEANKIMMIDDAAYAPGWDYYNPIILAKNVKGFVNGQENWYDFTTVSVE